VQTHDFPLLASDSFAKFHRDQLCRSIADNFNELLKRYVLEDSRALNPVGKDGKTFEIFDTKEKLTRR